MSCLSRSCMAGTLLSASSLMVVAFTFLTGCGADRAASVEAKTPSADYGPSSPPGYPPAYAPQGYPQAESQHVTTASAGREDAKKVEERPQMAGGFAAAAQPIPAPPPAPPPPPPPGPQPAQSTTTPASSSALLKGEPLKDVAPARDLVIYTARFSMAVYQVDQGLAAVEKIASDNGGYLGLKKDREITIRIPRGRFQPTLAAIDKIGDILHRDIQAEDVTDEHVDLEIRIKNALSMQKRLTDLLSKASVKDALEIEKELHRVTEELERMEGRLKVLKDRIAFSTITVVFEARGATIQAMRTRLPFSWLGGLNLPSLLSLSEVK